MQLTDQFTVPVAVDQLWEVLNDVERIAPCVPGFTLAEANHPEYRGRMRVKVGAITVSYDATIRFVERDEAARRVVLAVSGREVRGAGSVDATVTSTLQGDDHRTTAEMVTDVNVTGRVAQFGRGIIADVSSRMTEQFVERLNARVLAPPAPQEVSATQDEADRASTASRPAPAAPPAEEPLDLGSVAAVPVLKRIAPVVAGLALVALFAWLCRRRR